MPAFIRKICDTQYCYIYVIIFYYNLIEVTFGAKESLGAPRVFATERTNYLCQENIIELVP